MIIRTALLEGDVAPEDQAVFDTYMHDTVVEQIKRYPGILGVDLRRKIHADEASAPNIYMQFDLLFEDLAAMEAALASPVRAEIQARIKAGMGPFRGRVTHIVSEDLSRWRC